MTFRSFIALVLVAAMVVTGLTAAPARAGDNDAKIIAGAVALAVIGIAIANSNDRRDDYVVTRQRGYGYGHQPRHESRHKHRHKRHHKREAYGLPGGCRTRIHTNRGQMSGYGQQCLLRNYASFNALPHQCAVRVRGHGLIYDGRCLRKFGYR